MLCARIVVEKDGAFQYLCDNVVAIETQLKVDGKEPGPRRSGCI